jgi:N-acetylneuraminic acid mutarotase
MQNKSTRSLLSRYVLIPLLVFAATCWILSVTVLGFSQSQRPSNSFQRTLTFEDRVAYQRVIEEIYWRHRIWPKERPDPKPSLDVVMSQAQLESKVTDYLHKSQTLEDYWQRPLTTEQLQAEVDRMAEHTKQPKVLRELFEALGNDPFVIAECLVRPVLAQRFSADLTVLGSVPPALRNPLAAGTASSTERRVAVTANGAYTLPKISEGDSSCPDDSWTATSTTNAPSARTHHAAVWTGIELIVWGGTGSGGGLFNTGGRYNPSIDSWTATSTANAPTGRADETAVWTGTEMIVWGGFALAGYQNTGGRYNPGTDSWAATTTTNAPSGRQNHTTVWTGSQMVVWGGYDGTNYFNTGGRYDPSTDSWTTTTTTNAPSVRGYHTAVWTGSEMIVWGGYDGMNSFNTGGRYNPMTNSWTAMSTTNAADARNSHVAVWTGSEMIVWGGGSNGYLDTGGRYNPNTDSWVATTTTNAPIGRAIPKPVWTDSEMIIWGGFYFDGGGYHYLNSGGRYNPVTDIWTTTSTINAPSGRSGHTAVWTASEMIVWGGAAGGANYFDTGGRYCAQSGAPTPTPTPTATPTPTPTPTPCTGRCTPTPRPRPTPHPRP